MLNNKSILVTGGTGSFGKKFVETILQKYKPRRLIVFSRDELKQFEMSQVFNIQKYPSLRYFLGDVREYQRLKRAFEGVDIVVHAAALKQVPTAEYNPMEFIKTNVLGAENVINAALDSGVKKVVALSTDKAVAPINLYGATKLCADKLFIAANNMKGSREITFSLVRYGNVIGSRGSVVPLFLKERVTGMLSLTHPEMTRFNISLEDGVDLVIYAINNSWGGEVFIPKIPSYRITDLAKAIGPNCKVRVTGVRHGEKIHEEMITENESFFTVEIDKYYIILPSISSWKKEDFLKYFRAKKVKEGFKYTSNFNKVWLTVKELRQQIKQNVDPTFQE